MDQSVILNDFWSHSIFEESGATRKCSFFSTTATVAAFVLGIDGIEAW